MIIDLRTILEGSRSFEFCLDQDWPRKVNEADPGFKLDQTLSVKADIYKAGDKFILEGRLQGGIRIHCDRCLEPFHHDLNVRFRSVIALISLSHNEADKGVDKELIEDDLDIDIIKADVIDLADVVKEQIYLNLPMKLICSPDCQGLCPQCGVNLNLEKCTCNLNRGHPGFEKLKTLKFHKQ
jgi:uncharacterized protein